MKRKIEKSLAKEDAKIPETTVGPSPGEVGTGSGAAALRQVHFEILAPEAREVHLAGTFDDWCPTTLPMFRMENGIWIKEVMLAPGEYEYLFVVDGVWKPDPKASASRPNPFGGENSLITVTSISSGS